MNAGASVLTAPVLPTQAGLILRMLGPSGSGKTTLIARLIPVLSAAGYRVATAKSARHHEAPLDHAGTDTDRHARAGSAAAAGCFANGTVVRLPAGTDLAATAAWLALIADIVFVEGGHGLPFPALVLGGADSVERTGPGDVLARIDDRRAGDSRALHRDDIDPIAGLVIAAATGHEEAPSPAAAR
jgi:molybdopterin-guanine dinucleotide biosynthesis adapter protein